MKKNIVRKLSPKQALLMLFFILIVSFLFPVAYNSRDGWRNYQKTDLVKFDSKKIQVVNVKDYILGNEKINVVSEQAGQRIIWIDLMVENVSKKTDYFNNIVLIDSNNNEYEKSYYVGSEIENEISEFQPNIKSPKAVLFKVPADATGFKLKYKIFGAFSYAIVNLE